MFQIFVTGIQGFIERGLTFDDVRDFAVSVCKNITENSLDWDGDIICGGIIDVMGPHVGFTFDGVLLT